MILDIKSKYGTVYGASDIEYFLAYLFKYKDITDFRDAIVDNRRIQAHVDMYRKVLKHAPETTFREIRVLNRLLQYLNEKQHRPKDAIEGSEDGALLCFTLDDLTMGFSVLWQNEWVAINNSITRLVRLSNFGGGKNRKRHRFHWSMVRPVGILVLCW